MPHRLISDFELETEAKRYWFACMTLRRPPVVVGLISGSWAAGELCALAKTSHEIVQLRALTALENLRANIFVAENRYEGMRQ